MIRSILAFTALGLLALFGYFFVTSQQPSGKERAREAAANVGDTVVAEGVAGLVRARLLTTLGYDVARFLHVHNDNGRVLVYGLLPDDVRVEDVIHQARQAPGVTTVDVQVMPRPEYLRPAKETAARPPAAQP